MCLLILEHKRPLSKRHAASLLWPDANAECARDCLYKTLSWLRTHPKVSSPFGLQILRNCLSVCMDQIQSDLAEFDQCYSHRSDIHCCERAVELYQGPLFWKDYFNWIDVWQSEYEIRYSVFLQNLAAYHCQQGNTELGGKYLHLMDA